MRRKPVVAKKTAMQALSALAGALALTAGAVEVDGIAARVGTETILKSDVAMEMQRLRAPASSYDEVRAGMIDRKLILQELCPGPVCFLQGLPVHRHRHFNGKQFFLPDLRHRLYGDAERRGLPDVIPRRSDEVRFL